MVVGIPLTGTLDAASDLKGAADKVRSSRSSSRSSPGSSATWPSSTPRPSVSTRSRSQFDTRTIVLIPIAIAINIILGQTVASALKVPIYLDSIGTILVGVLAGPLAGALTGGLANLIWTYVLPAPFHSDYAAPFFIVAVEIGLLAGVFGRLGFFRSRPNSPPQRLAIGALVVVVVVAVIGIYGFLPFYTNSETNILELFFFAPPAEGVPPPSPVFVILRLDRRAAPDRGGRRSDRAPALRRDLGAAYVFVGRADDRRSSRRSSRAPIATVFFGGVTGSGTDLLVAAFQQAGDRPRRRRSLKQGLLSDPIDKTLTFFVVFALLGALSRRFVARFPQGEEAVGLEAE